MEEKIESAEITNGGYKEKKNVGIAVILVLIALTVGEFFIGSIAVDWSWPLWGIALLKAALIIYYFMHVTRVFGMSKEDQS